MTDRRFLFWLGAAMVLAGTAGLATIIWAQQHGKAWA